MMRGTVCANAAHVRVCGSPGTVTSQGHPVLVHKTTESPLGHCRHIGGAHTRFSHRVRRRPNLLRSTTPTRLRATCFVHSVTHDQANSDESVVRSGLTALLHFPRVISLILWRQTALPAVLSF